MIGDQLGIGILAGADRVEYVAFGQDADAGMVVIDHDGGPDPVRGHQPDASRSVCAGPTVRTNWVMPSRTFIGVAPREVVRVRRSVACSWLISVQHRVIRWPRASLRQA